MKTSLLGDVLTGAVPGFACGDDLEEGLFQIRMNNLTRDGRLTFGRRRRVPPNHKQAHSRLLGAGDVLFNATNSPELVGKSAYFHGCDEPAVYSNHFLRLRTVVTELDASYLSRWLQKEFERGYFKASCKQWVNQATFGRDRLLKLSIPLPPIEEQRRIAAILDAADALRILRRQAIAKLDSLTRAIFIDMFGDSVVNPMGWPTESVQDVCEVVVDCVNKTAPLAETQTEFKMIRTTNVKAGSVDLTAVRHVEEDIFEKWTRRVLPRRGDVILTREAPVGECGVLQTEEKVFLGQRLMLYRPDLSRVTAEFLARSFNGRFMQHQYDAHGSGSTVKHLKLPVCRSLRLRVPPVDLQWEFGVRLSVAEGMKIAGIRGLADLDTLFASLQQRAFRGEL